MSLLMRRCSGNVRNIDKYRRVCVAIPNRRNNSSFCTDEIPKYSLVTDQHRRRGFHTTIVNNKIVAFNLSDIGEGIREVVIKEWFVKVGDKVQQFDNVCEVQSDKAAVTITSRYDGVVTKLYHEVDQTAFVGSPLVDIEVEGDAAENTKHESNEKSGNEKATEKVPEIVERQNITGKVLTTPAVRRIASQFNVDLKTVKATGRNGRVLKEDVLSYLNITSDMSNEVPLETEVRALPKPAIQPKTTTGVILEDKIVPVTGFAKAMFKTMTESMKIPHFVFSDEYEVSNLIETRKNLKKAAEEKGVKLTYMPIIIKAASQSLKSFPILNSRLDDSGDKIIMRSSHNIGVAMDTPSGLVVPVIKNVQSKTILEIARELNILQQKGSKDELGLSDLADGTFSISNIGIVGGTYTKPVILPPQVAIGALGKIQVVPRFDSEGNVVKAHILTASWSADHRIIDGVTMARFSNSLKQYLENPSNLLLDI